MVINSVVDLCKERFEHSRTMNIIVDHTGKIRYINSSGAMNLGLNQVDLFGSSIYSITHEEDCHKLEIALQSLTEQTIKCIEWKDRKTIARKGFRTFHNEAQQIKIHHETFCLIRSSLINDHKPIYAKKRVKQRSQDKLLSNYKAFFDHYPDPVYSLDRIGLFTYVNRSFTDYTGYSSDELINQHFIKLVEPKYLELTRSYFERVKKGESLQYSIHVKLKEGRLIEVDITSVPIVVKGEVIAIYCIAKDVTIINQKKEQLRQIEERYQLIEKNSFDMISKNTKDGKFTYVSPASYDLLGYKPFEMYGKNACDYIHPEDATSIRKKICSLGTARDKYTYRIRKKDGTYTWFESMITLLQTPPNQPDEYLSISRDISERKKSEEILEESNQRYRRLIHNSLDTIAIIADHKFVFINDSGVKMFEADNYTDIHGRNLYDFLYPEYHEICRQRVKHVLEHQEPVDLIEQEWFTLKGKTLYTEVIGLPTAYLNQPAVQIIIRDITERKKAEEIMLQSEKLSIAGQLAAGVAHEIRNPLTSLKGFIQLMESGSNDKQIYYDIMRSELNRIELILSELLMLSKPQAHNYRSMDIRGLIQHVVTLLDTQAIINNVQIISTFCSEPLIINCDENQIKQVFINFLKNSIEAMPKGGTVSIDARREGEYSVIRLTDEGCGIPEEIIDKIGQPFYTTKEKGTGLGMMVSYNIIENHNGKIDVQSEVNKGTMFTVYIPISDTPES
ncbi:PAS domain-containing sensor histidine kinase [Caldalkalibacillus mannanilyticus]|uniref:PAS domain-containing sensor histidine kinase n=1 Tax=Caldalkalibacillus mannanilyticus TaxID=1418 RepID=UPI0004680FB0|nr:PAS domain-containing sensor histidine kinase [Caldalkalibacillus mannanilyticus]